VGARHPARVWLPPGGGAAQARARLGIARFLGPASGSLDSAGPSRDLSAPRVRAGAERTGPPQVSVTVELWNAAGAAGAPIDVVGPAAPPPLPTSLPY